MNPHHLHVNTLSKMDTFKIEIDAESKDFSLKIPFDKVKEFIEEERTINIPPETFKQAYYFQHNAEEKENFSINVGLKDNYEEEEYDKEFWEEYHNNHSVEEEVSFISETGTINESGEKTIASKEELKNTEEDTYWDEYYSPELYSPEAHASCEDNDI